MFPSPLGGSILITIMKTCLKSLLRVSVPSRGINSHYKEGKDYEGQNHSFRPLSGNQFSLLLCRSLCKDREGFRPLSGIQFSLRRINHDGENGNEFPSPLGDSILITAPQRDRQRPVDVSVPSRGFNSHYCVGTFFFVPFPSCFRPLSGIQFSLR